MSLYMLQLLVLLVHLLLLSLYSLALRILIGRILADEGKEAIHLCQILGTEDEHQFVLNRMMTAHIAHGKDIIVLAVLPLLLKRFQLCLQNADIGGIVFLAILFSHVAYAQNERNKALIYSYLHGWEYSIKAGLSIGGTSPLPLPKEIRSIDSYAPNIAIAIEGNTTKWFGKDKKWGMTAGIRLENKTMTTEATVKNYGMKIINTNGGELQGLWTGGVKTKVKNSYLTIPVLANYKISDRWKVSLGPYVSYMTEGNFSGHVYEGHLRTPDETGQRVDFRGESVATYDFSDNLRKFQWGAQLGGEWKAFKHLNVYADLTWGLNDIFKKDFDTITFAMYPIYLNIGFGYAF